MKIIFVGAGAMAAPAGLWQSNILIEKNNRLLLIDAGTDIRHSLGELALHPIIHTEAERINNGNVGQLIDSLYVSHLHSDHVGGIGWMALMSKFTANPRKINLYSNHALMNELWEKTLRGDLETLEGEIATLTTFFNCHPIEDNGSFTWEGIHFQTVQTLHVVSGYKFQHSFGLLISDFEGEGKKVFITTDTQFAPRQLPKFYDQADIIFHDCETSPFKSNVHAHYDDLKTLDPKHKSKMWLYHYNQMNPSQDTKSDGFMGFVPPGRIFTVD